MVVLKDHEGYLVLMVGSKEHDHDFKFKIFLAVILGEWNKFNNVFLSYKVT